MAVDGLGSLTLIVKAPNQKFEDQRVACDRSWTVRQLKEHLSTVHPEQPHQDQQKLVYFGKLLKDEACLHEVLTQDCYDDAHTVHLVCPPRSVSNDFHKSYIPRFKSSNSNQQRTELRHRSSTANGNRQYEQLAQQPVQADALNQPAQLWESYWDQIQYYHAYQHYASSLTMTAQQKLWLQLYQQQFAMFNAQVQHSMGGAHFMSSPGMDVGGHIMTPENQAADAPARPADNAAQANDNQDDVVRMNAQGGLDADGDQNDWLDTMYAFVRFGTLLMLLFFYTTFTRFAVVFAIGAFFYIARGNMFRPRRRINMPQQVPQQPQQNEHNQAAENQNNENNERDTQVNHENRENIATEQRASWIDSVKLLCTFIVTFFSSLVPQNPAAAAN